MTATALSHFASRPAKRATLLLGVRDRAGHGSLMVELLRRAKRAKLAGATAFEAQQGFGASGRIHRTHLLSEDAPIAVVLIDRAERIEAFLDEVADLLDDVLVTTDEIDIVEL